MKITLFFILVTGLFFSVLLFPETAYACSTTNPDGSRAERDVTGTCGQYTCNDGSQPANWYTALVTYTYTTGTPCTQTEFFTTNQCTTAQTGSDPCPNSCTSDSGCVTGAYCTGGIANFNYCTQPRNGQNGTWCESWNCGASCDATQGCQPWPVCNTAPCPGTAPYSSVDSCNTAKTANGGLCPGTPTATPVPTATPTPTPSPTGVPPTPTPTPTPGGPTPTPTPIGCVPCGTGDVGFCSDASAFAFPPACRADAVCTGPWTFQGNKASDECADNYPGVYPWCWACSIPAPTPTPDPLTTPTPTIAVPSCLDYSRITSTTTRNLCGPGSAPADDDDPSTAPIRFTQVSYSTYISCCSPYTLGSVYCNQVSTDPDYGTWQGSCRVPAAGPAPSTYTRSGTVFVDLDANGIKQGTSEPGWAGARISLSGGGLSSAQNTTSSSDALNTGYYEFTGLPSGNGYLLELETPFGFSPAASFRQVTFPIPPDGTTNLPLVPYQVTGGVYKTTDPRCPPSSSQTTPLLGHSPIDLTELWFSINYPSDTVDMGTDPYGLYNFSVFYNPPSVLAPSATSSIYSITTTLPTSTIFSCLTATNTSGTTTTITTPPPYEFPLSWTDYKKTINFYYLMAVPWFRGVGGDMRIDSGFRDQLPPRNDDPPRSPPKTGRDINRYVSLNGDGGTPGVLFSGDNFYDFCLADGNCIERSSQKRWVVGGQPSTGYPETFTSAIPGTTRTSYGYLSGVVKQNGITPEDLPDDCYDPSGCTLPSPTLSEISKNKDGTTNVYIKNSTFSNGNYVLLIKGDLHILDNIHVSSSPATTLTVSVSGNIFIDKNVGGGAGAVAIHVKGFYSSDGSFIVESNSTDNVIGSNCSTTPPRPDNRLNMEGAVVVNAALSSGGKFEDKRSLCGNNVDHPTFQIEERPDFILNAPDILKHPSFVWQEVAP